MRVGLVIAVLCLTATLASSAAAGTGAVRAASLKIAVPAAGHFSLTPISVTSKSGKKPKLKVVGAVGTTLVVAAGLTADPKHKGRFIGAVALLSRKTAKTTRSTQGQARASATFVVVNAAGGDIAPLPSLREAICQASAGDSIIAGSSFLDNPPGPGITPFMDAEFAASCPGHFGTFDGAAAGTTFLTGLVGGTVTPPTNTGTFTIGFAHIFGAGSNSSNDCETVTVKETGLSVLPNGTLTLTGPSGFTNTSPLTFSPGSGGGVFVAPSTILISSFGTYNESASITVNGATSTGTGTWTIDASSDKTTPPCSAP
jgi:hypothetical protein